MNVGIILLHCKTEKSYDVKVESSFVTILFLCTSLSVAYMTGAQSVDPQYHKHCIVQLVGL